jgi:membrane fusion protein, multidrug efflux system
VRTNSTFAMRTAGTGGIRSLVAFGILHLAVLAAACGGDAESTDSAAPVGPAAVQIGAENIVTARRGSLVVGPMISGELRAAREATVRAEIGGPVLQVMVEEGQSVRKGTLLGRIDAQSLADTRQSAMSALRSAENQLALGRREAARTEELVKAGALAQRELDVALNQVSTAEAQVADARARLAGANTQLADAVIRAPISGIVSDRPVNAGDVVSPGTALVTIIDPSSMQLEAAVPSDDLRVLRPGVPVQFSVRGYDEPFTGSIERIAPQADPTTRQVPIFVAIPNVGGRLVAGLFAEGRVVSETTEGIVVPANAVNVTGATPWVLRVTNGKAEKIEVKLGLRDERTEQVQIAAGVNEGDILLRGSAQGITPGTPVQVGGAD